MQQKERDFYVDIDLTLTPHPLTGDITKKVNSDAVLRSIQHAIFMNRFDVPFNPVLFCNLKTELFNPVDLISASNIKTKIENALKRTEQRIKVTQIEVEPNFEEDGYSITIQFKLGKLEKEELVQFTLNRIR